MLSHIVEKDMKHTPTFSVMYTFAKEVITCRRDKKLKMLKSTFTSYENQPEGQAVNDYLARFSARLAPVQTKSGCIVK